MPRGRLEQRPGGRWMVKRMAPTLRTAASSCSTPATTHRRSVFTALRGKALTIRVGPARRRPTTRCEASWTSRRCCAGWPARSRLTPMARACEARSPHGCVELRQTLDVHALDERELGTACRRCRPSRSSSHTFATSSATGRSRPAYGNDFRALVALELGDRALTERLAVGRSVRVPGRERAARASGHDRPGHLRGRDESRRVEFDRAFHFQRSYSSRCRSS